MTFDYSIDNLMQKDSRFINNNDRETILKHCLDCLESQIIITHGSITMSKTAKHIGKANLDKTIILCGAMVPANREQSDALFNI
ncbi:MAG: asparaginase domain-containing protein [bacterium]